MARSPGSRNYPTSTHSSAIVRVRRALSQDVSTDLQIAGRDDSRRPDCPVRGLLNCQIPRSGSLIASQRFWAYPQWQKVRTRFLIASEFPAAAAFPQKLRAPTTSPPDAASSSTSPRKPRKHR